MTNRLKTVLETFISENQQGFMPGRRCATNIRRVLDLIELADMLQIEGLILSLDYEKCFDRVEIELLVGALRYFGTGNTFCKWTTTIFKGAKANVINNGNLSDDIDLTRGLQQGGSCSPYYFLHCAEVLSQLLRNEKNVKGFQIRDFDKILGQFADDMDMYLLYNQGTFDSVIRILNEFQENSGFKVNYDKTAVY